MPPLPMLPHNFRDFVETDDDLDTDPTDLDALDARDAVAVERRERVRRKVQRRPEREISNPFERAGRLTEDERARVQRSRTVPAVQRGLPDWADRWSTWDDGERGPRPRPAWLVTEPTAVDTELGVLKTGKEADVHLVERGVPDTERRCLLAAKRYRAAEHRQFHRDAGYLEGRRVRKSRETRAMAGKTSFGRNLVAEQWAVAEFGALGALWKQGVPVPYPAQRVGRELLLEFIGTPDGGAAPRLAQLRPDPDELADLWRQLLDALTLMATLGYTHGDLSAYNLLVHEGRLVLIDLPQVVDVVANPQGYAYLERDVTNVCGWFAGHGIGPDRADPVAVTERLAERANLR